MHNHELLTTGFSSWLREIRKAQFTKQGAQVPCGDCKACCTSSYFLHIRPDEEETLASIPKNLLFPAPNLPEGHKVLGYDENGHCPMFREDKCSIYKQRPKTCRRYDCRIFTATGLEIEETRPLISQQAKRWKFAFPSAQDYKELKAVQSAAKFLKENSTYFPAGFIPANSTQLAMLAIKVYQIFLNLSSNHIKYKTRIQNTVQEVVTAFRHFEAD